jgi:hypothetical protein
MTEDVEAEPDDDEFLDELLHRLITPVSEIQCEKCAELIRQGWMVCCSCCWGLPSEVGE